MLGGDGTQEFSLSVGTPATEAQQRWGMELAGSFTDIRAAEGYNGFVRKYHP